MFNDLAKAMDFDAFCKRAVPIIRETVGRQMDYETIARMVQTRIEIFPDIPQLIDFLKEVPEYDIAMYTHKKMKTTAASSLTVLKEVLGLLEETEDFSNDALYEKLLAFAQEKEYKNGYVMWPIRTAVSGKQMTPGGATELMALLGKEESLARIRAAITKLEEAGAAE